MNNYNIIRYFKLRRYKSSPVIIIHSLFKTGTTSMGKALLIIGVGKKEMEWRPDIEKKYREKILLCNNIAYGYIDFNKFKNKHRFFILKKFRGIYRDLYNHDIFSDFPIGHVKIHPFIKKIIFPNSKFIWINRNIDSWVESACNWMLTHKEIWPDAEETWKDYEKQKEIMVALWNSEHDIFKSLQHTFPNDCLEVGIDQGWEAICKFFDKEIPHQEYPHVNKAK